MSLKVKSKFYGTTHRYGPNKGDGLIELSEDLTAHQLRTAVIKKGLPINYLEGSEKELAALKKDVRTNANAKRPVRKNVVKTKLVKGKAKTVTQQIIKEVVKEVEVIKEVEKQLTPEQESQILTAKIFKLVKPTEVQVFLSKKAADIKKLPKIKEVLKTLEFKTVEDLIKKL